MPPKGGTKPVITEVALINNVRNRGGQGTENLGGNMHVWSLKQLGRRGLNPELANGIYFNVGGGIGVWGCSS